MVHVDATDPISTLLEADETTLAHLKALISGTGASTHPDGPALQAAIGWLEGPARAQRRILEQQVFPALVESMAGSDAVCLRNLTTGLMHEANQLDNRWRITIRPQLAAGVLASSELSAWVAAFENHLRRIDSDLLPMVPRLFDDEALDVLSRACGDLRSTTGH